MIEPNPNDRLLESIRAIIRTEMQSLAYAGVFDYSIQAVHGTPPNVTIDCNPTDDTIGLPPLVGIPMSPAIDGITSIPTTGIHCSVVFLNRNPTLPRIVGVDSLGVVPIARLGDSVIAGPYAGTITTASTKAYTG